MSKKVKRTAEAKRSQKMTDPTPTRDQMMMDLSEKALAGMISVLAEKQNKRDSTTKGKLDNLKSLREDKIDNKDEQNKRIQKVQSKLDKLENVVK